jgi:hypothetical protein
MLNLNCIRMFVKCVCVYNIILYCYVLYLLAYILNTHDITNTYKKRILQKFPSLHHPATIIMTEVW